MVTWFESLWLWLSRPEVAPSVVPADLKRPPAQASTANLYILQVDFPVSPEKRLKIGQSLDELREKYGIDFVLLEPGIKLSRFDDI